MEFAVRQTPLYIAFGGIHAECSIVGNTQKGYLEAFRRPPLCRIFCVLLPAYAVTGVSPPKTSYTYSLYFYLRIVQSRVIMDCVSGFAAVYKFSADADLCGEFICKLFNLLKKGA